MTIDQHGGQPRKAGKGSGEARGVPKGSPHDELAKKLKAAREARGVDFYRVERDTKIRVKYLTAMENGEFDQLPGEVYVRGFLRNYASYLGLDPDETESEWRRGLVAPRPVRKAPLQPSAAPQAPAGRVFSLRVPELRVPNLGSLLGRPGVPPAQPSAPAAQTPTAPTAPADPAVPVEAESLDGVESNGVGPVYEAPETAPARSARSARVAEAEVPASLPPGAVAAVTDADADSETPARIVDGPAETVPGRFRGRTLPKVSLPSFSLPNISLGRRGNVDPTEQFRGPDPLPMPGRTFLIQPIHIVVAALLIVVLAVSGFFAIQAQRVLDNPTVSVTAPDTGFTQVSTGTRTYLLEGKANPKAEIDISVDQRTPMKTQADASGAWTFEVTLHSGVNQIDVYCVDLQTGHKSATVTRYLSLPTPTASPVPMFISIDSPTGGQSFRNGNVTVYGSTVSVVSVTVTATYLGAAPSNLTTPTPRPTTHSSTPTEVPTLMPLATDTPTPAGSPTPTPRPTPVPSGAPEPVTVIPTIDGKYEAPMHLWSGRWKLTAIGYDKNGAATAPAEQTVIVTAGSLNVTIVIKGSATQIKIWKDGKVVPGYNVSPYRKIPAGTTIRVVADQSVWIFTGVPNRTFVAVNGVDFGRLGSGNDAGSWRITAFGSPTPSNDR